MGGVHADDITASGGIGKNLGAEGAGEEGFLGGGDGGVRAGVIPGIGNDAVLGGPGAGGESGDGGGGKGAGQMAAIGKMCSFRQNEFEALGAKLAREGVQMIGAQLF